MDFDPEDQEIIRLLAKVRDVEGEYPQHMLEARRRSFLRQMGQIGLSIGAEQPIKHATKDVKPPTVSPAVSTLLETALVAAILAEAGAVAYFYRDQLTDFFRKIADEPRVQEVTPPPGIATPFEIQGVTPSSALPSTAPSATLWTASTPTDEIAARSTSTPIPGVVDDTINNSLNSTSGVNVLNSTPAPNINSANNGNNGHHYGQTPKPERTKENGNNPPPRENNNNPPRENNNPPPGQNNNNPPGQNNSNPPGQDNNNPPGQNNNPPGQNNNNPPGQNNDNPPRR